MTSTSDGKTVIHDTGLYTTPHTGISHPSDGLPYPLEQAPRLRNKPAKHGDVLSHFSTGEDDYSAQIEFLDADSATCDVCGELAPVIAVNVPDVSFGAICASCACKAFFGSPRIKSPIAGLLSELVDLPEGCTYDDLRAVQRKAHDLLEEL
jgi:hypothetical protein